MNSDTASNSIGNGSTDVSLCRPGCVCRSWAMAFDARRLPQSAPTCPGFASSTIRHGFSSSSLSDPWFFAARRLERRVRQSIGTRLRGVRHVVVPLREQWRERRSDDRTGIGIEQRRHGLDDRNPTNGSDGTGTIAVDYAERHCPHSVPTTSASGRRCRPTTSRCGRAGAVAALRARQPAGAAGERQSDFVPE